MENILHQYFGWDYVLLFAIIIIVLWIIIGGYFLRRQRKKYSHKPKVKFKEAFRRGWWFWTGNILVVLHMSSITFINPSYFGYGTPDYFELIEVRDNYVILYDYKYAQNNSDDDNAPIPNLRVHVIDRLKHERVHWELIGDYYYPLIYGSCVILKENNTYGKNKDYSEIQSISYFDTDHMKVKTLAENEGIVRADEKNVKVYDILNEHTGIKIKTPKGDMYKLDDATLQFHWYNPEDYIYPDKPRYVLRVSKNSPDKQVLYIDDKETSYEFLEGNIVNEHSYGNSNYILIYSKNDLEATNPHISMIKGAGELLWDISLQDLRNFAGNTNLPYIHRTLIYKNVCYVTCNQYLYEFDLETGALGWVIDI